MIIYLIYQTTKATYLVMKVTYATCYFSFCEIIHISLFQLHLLSADEFRQMYPDFDHFLAIRKEMDPTGLFLNDYLKRVLGVTE